MHGTVKDDDTGGPASVLPGDHHIGLRTVLLGTQGSSTARGRALESGGASVLMADDWTRAQELIESGEADALVVIGGAAPTQDELARTRISRPDLVGVLVSEGGREQAAQTALFAGYDAGWSEDEPFAELPALLEDLRASRLERWRGAITPSPRRYQASCR